MEGIICGVQLIPLIGSILPTEISIKRILIRMEQDDKVCRIKKIGFVEGSPMKEKTYHTDANDSLLGK